MSHTYGEKPTDFRVGMRVELHPGTDLWMRGARYGTIAKVGRRWVWVKLDELKRLVKFDASLMRYLD